MRFTWVAIFTLSTVASFAPHDVGTRRLSCASQTRFSSTLPQTDRDDDFNRELMLLKIDLAVLQDRLRQGGLDASLPSEGSTPLNPLQSPRRAGPSGQGTGGSVATAGPPPPGVFSSKLQATKAFYEDRMRTPHSEESLDERLLERTQGVHLRTMSTASLKETLRRMTARELTRIIELPEDSNAIARATMHELNMPPEMVEYAMKQRARIKPPRVGSKPFKGATDWWSRVTGVHVD